MTSRENFCSKTNLPHQAVISHLWSPSRWKVITGSMYTPESSVLMGWNWCWLITRIEQPDTSWYNLNALFTFISHTEPWSNNQMTSGLVARESAIHAAYPSISSILVCVRSNFFCPNRAGEALFTNNSIISMFRMYFTHFRYYFFEQNNWLLSQSFIHLKDFGKYKSVWLMDRELRCLGMLFIF